MNYQKSRKPRGKGWHLMGYIPADTAEILIIDPLNLGKKDRHLGITFQTGYGDGLYPAWARVEKTKELGERVVEVRILTGMYD